MEFRVLGPFEVLGDDGPVPLGGSKQRSLLALLLLHANEVVSRDRLLEELWRERAHEAAHSLDVQIARLRKLLPPERLLTRPGGYLLQVEPGELDAQRFEDLVEQGRRANDVETLRAALALWRGQAYADVAYEDFARVESARLEELRLVATEERIEAELALGGAAALVPELEQLTARHPLRERLRAQLMLALYRSGRQAEALQVYADARRRLVEELGLEPSQRLQQLERAILQQDPALDVARAAERRVHRRRYVYAAPVAVGVLAVLVLAATHGSKAPRAAATAEPQSVAFVSTSTGKLVRATPARAVVLERFGFGSLWALSFDGELTRIDPRTGKVLATIGTGVVPNGMAAGLGAVWVTDSDSPTLLKIDPSQNIVTDHFPLPTKNTQPVTATGGVAVGDGSVWVGQGHLNPLSWLDRIDPATGRLERRFLIPGGAGDGDEIGYADGQVWVGGGGSRNMTHVDAAANSIVVTTQVEPHGYVCCVTAGGGYAWAVTTQDRTVWKIAPDGSKVASYRLRATPENLVYARGAVWAADGDSGAVIRIDALTGVRRRYVVGHQAIGVAVGAGLIAAGVQPNSRDLLATVHGPALHVLLGEQWLNATDPIFTPSWNTAASQLAYATCAKLYNYPDTAGPPGRTLVPELAAGFPHVADSGRTYVIRVRPGYRFSPPSNEAVTAETMRHTLERTLSPKLLGRGGGIPFLGDVIGAAAFEAGETAHVAGLRRRGDTLVIRLAKPVPDLPRRLAATAFCAVPLGTPALANGVPSALPSAGPYYVAASGGEVTVVRRNPNYHGPRPHRVPTIVYTADTEASRAIQLIGSGRGDYVSEYDAALASGSPAARAAGGRYRLLSGSAASYLALNPNRPLFRDPRWRRAVQLGFDRSRFAALDFSRPASDLLPPSLDGHEPGTYPLGGDLSAARKLTRGQHVHAALATFDPGYEPQSALHARTLRQELASLGIYTTIVPLTFADHDDPAKWAALLARSDIVSWQSDAAYPDPVTYLQSLPYLTSGDRTALARAATVGSPARERAAAVVARRLRARRTLVVYAYSGLPVLVSRRVGCVVHQPEYPGLDLAALCLTG